jgi:small subunit ribosomal protein S16
MGKKKRAYYRIVAADSRRARDGRFLEILGTYNPITTPAQVHVHEDKLSQWLDQGARPSDTVASLLRQIGFTEKYNKARGGEDVSETAVKTVIKERRKRTRKVKKAAVAAAEAAAAEATAEATAEAAPAAPAEETAPADSGDKPEADEAAKEE